MIGIAIENVFNGVDDDELQSVDLPKAYLRFIACFTPEEVYWLDASYSPVMPSSEELAIIENSIGVITGAANV